MKKVYCLFLFAISLGISSTYAQSCPDGSYQWSDIYQIFDNAYCTTCHFGEDFDDGFSGLSFDSYVLFSDGGTICGANILSGNNLVSILANGITVCNEEDTVIGPMIDLGLMDSIQEEELSAIQSWIDAGAPEFCDTSTTTVQSIEQNLITIFPNPAVNLIQIKSERNSTNTLNLKIYSVTKALFYHNTNYQPDTKIDVSALPSGVYFITDERRTIFNKFVKL